MKKALFLGIAASFFFAFTFTLNRSMHEANNSEAGSWVNEGKGKQGERICKIFAGSIYYMGRKMHLCGKRRDAMEDRDVYLLCI